MYRSKMSLSHSSLSGTTRKHTSIRSPPFLMALSVCNIGYFLALGEPGLPPTLYFGLLYAMPPLGNTRTTPQPIDGLICKKGH